jgi:hypothetical protein
MIATQNMLNHSIEAEYKAMKVQGRSKFCPRLGTYKIISISRGTCLGKSALMAIAHWRPPNISDYELSYQLEVQLQSLFNDASAEQVKVLNSDDLLQMEIQINFAYYNEATRVFELDWKFVEQEKETLEQLKERMKNSLEKLPDDDFFHPDDDFGEVDDELK